MSYLIAVTLLWAFSYSLIGVYLSGQVDSYVAVFTRITLALALFAPLMRVRGMSTRLALSLMAIGAVQLGLMYVFFYQSFLWLSVPQVLLFTIFTPVYITLLEDMLATRFTPFYLVAALVAALGAVAGAAIIRYQGVGTNYWIGFGLVQAANLCFAAGQVGYRRVAHYLPDDMTPASAFGWFFLGAWIVTAGLLLGCGDFSAMPQNATQWIVLLWLGLGASGLGYCAWNVGATRVNAGVLAVMNNLLIPAGLAVNLIIWNQDANISRLSIGTAIIVLSLGVSMLWARGWKLTPLRNR